MTSVRSGIRQRFVRIAAVLVLGSGVAFGAAGCGAGTHLAGNVIAHKIANHFAHTPAQRRAVNKAFCLLSVYQAFRDVRHHHLVYGAATAAVAIRDCERGFAKGK